MIDIKDKFRVDSWTLIYNGQCITPLSYKIALKHLDYLAEEINNKNSNSRVALLIRSVPTFRSECGYTESYVTAYKVRFPASYDGYIIKPFDCDPVTNM